MHPPERAILVTHPFLSRSREHPERLGRDFDLLSAAPLRSLRVGLGGVSNSLQLGDTPLVDLQRFCAGHLSH